MRPLRKNVAGQFIFFQGVKASDGSAFTDTVSATVAKDGGNAAAIGGTVALVTGSSGMYRCAPNQADTNADFLGFNFTGTGMIPVAANMPTTALDPQDDVTGGIKALPNVTAGNPGALPTDTDANGAVRIVDGTGPRELNTFNGDVNLQADQSGTTIGTTTNAVNILTAVTVGTNNDKTGYALSAAGVDAIWDEPQAGHTTAGTFGKHLDVEVSSVSGGGGLTAQDVRDAMKLAPTVGAPAAGSVDLHLDDIQGKTDQMNFTGNDIQSVASNMRGTDDALLATSAPANFADLSITATTGRIDLGAWKGSVPDDLTTGLVKASTENDVTLAADQPVDVVKVNGNAQAAVNLDRGANAQQIGAVNDASATATEFVTDLPSTVNDAYKGRILTFATGAVVAKQAATITAYDGTTKRVTVAATELTTAPNNGDTFYVS